MLKQLGANHTIILTFQFRFELPPACDLINAAFSGAGKKLFYIVKKEKSKTWWL